MQKGFCFLNFGSIGKTINYFSNESVSLILPYIYRHILVSSSCPRKRILKKTLKSIIKVTFGQIWNLYGCFLLNTHSAFFLTPTLPRLLHTFSHLPHCFLSYCYIKILNLTHLLLTSFRNIWLICVNRYTWAKNIKWIKIHIIDYYSHYSNKISTFF